MPFDGRRVLTLESRKAPEIAAMIEREGGIPISAPSVRERPKHDPQAQQFLSKLEDGAFDMVILMTGVGLGFLRDALGSEKLANALSKVTVVARGPKPIVVLRQMGLTPQIAIGEPNTWKEIIAAVAARPERRIAVQEYGRPNPAFYEALTNLNAQVEAVAPYRWELPEDIAPLEKRRHSNPQSPM
ncbi:MAG: uroporphyrinogen-III synthase [Vicinamibacterales bacterium]